MHVPYLVPRLSSERILPSHLALDLLFMWLSTIAHSYFSYKVFSLHINSTQLFLKICHYQYRKLVSARLKLMYYC